MCMIMELTIIRLVLVLIRPNIFSKTNNHSPENKQFFRLKVSYEPQIKFKLNLEK